jgi:hypothetical protein
MKDMDKRDFFIYFSALLSLSLPVSIFMQISLFNIGHDFVVYCDAATAFGSNLNPYYVSNLEHSSLSFVYPPITLPVFAAMCSLKNLFPIDVVYTLYYSILLVFTYIVVKKSEDSSDSRTQTLFLVTLLVSGYIGAFWNFSTGNIGILGGAALAVLYFGLNRDREWLGILSISLVSIFKIFPALFAIAHSISSKSSGRAIKLLSRYMILGGLSVGVSYILFPELMHSYYLAITGQLPQHSPINEGGGASTPALLFLLIGIGEFMFGSGASGVALYLVLLSLVAAALLKIYKKENIDRATILSFSIIGILLLIPRLKPYTLSYAVIPTYYLVKDWNIEGKTLILIFAVVIPSIARVLQFIIPAIYETGMPFYLRPINYAQPISLGLVFVTCYLVYLNYNSTYMPKTLIEN